MRRSYTTKILLGFLSLSGPLCGITAVPFDARDLTVYQEGFFIPGSPNYTTTILDNFYGRRNISYHATEQGHIIIDGDIMYGTAHDLKLAEAAAASSHLARAYSLRGRPWTGAKVRYQYADDDTERANKDTINAAIKRWKDNAPYLTFERVMPNSKSENGNVIIQSTDCSGCYSTVGSYQRGNIMSLQRGCRTCSVDQITHEWGHILGLLHEHQRPDRDQYVRLVCKNIDPRCTLPPGTSCCNNVNELPAGCCQLKQWLTPDAAGNWLDWDGMYDGISLMHYSERAFARPNTKTLVPARNDVVINTNIPGWPTKRDLHRICKIYSDECSGEKGMSRDGFDYYMGRG